MPSDLVDLLQNVLAGLLTGGASAGTTFLAVFRDLRNKLQELEKKVGVIPGLEEAIKGLRRRIDGWEDEPPTWAKRLLNRSRNSSLNDLDDLREIETRVERLGRDLSQRLRRMEDEFGELDRDTRSSIVGIETFLSKEEYLRDQNDRLKEIGQFRESLGQINGMIRGILATMNAEPPRKSSGNLPATRR